MYDSLCETNKNSNKMSYEFYWLAIGVFLTVIEISFIQRRGFLFAGMAAISVFLLIELKIIEAFLLMNILYFILLTLAWGVILWWPLKILDGIIITDKKNSNNLN